MAIQSIYPCLSQWIIWILYIYENIFQTRIWEYFVPDVIKWLPLSQLRRVQGLGGLDVCNSLVITKKLFSIDPWQNAITAVYLILNIKDMCNRLAEGVFWCVVALLEAARRINFKEIATQIAAGFASGRYHYNCKAWPVTWLYIY